MTYFKKALPPPGLFAAIEVQSLSQTLQAAAAAFTNGANGIFLLIGTLTEDVVIELLQTVCATYSDKFVGVRFIDCNADRAFTHIMNTTIKALWVHDPGPLGPKFPSAGDPQSAMQTKNWPGYYFVGVSNQANQPPINPSLAARICHALITDVSGLDTAQIDEKIGGLQMLIGEKPIIVAGATADNVAALMPHAAHFITEARADQVLEMARKICDTK